MASPISRTDPLRSAKLKIKWAKSYIQDLNATLEEFARVNPYKFVEEVDPVTDFLHVKIRPAIEIPEAVEKLTANIISSLRSTLDIIIVALAKANGRGTADAYFPTASSLKEFESADIQKKIKMLTPDAIALIHALEPYEGGNGAPFWALGKLEAMNKHNNLVPVANPLVPLLKNAKIFASGPISWPSGGWDAADESMTLFIMKPGSKAEYEFHISFYVSFREPEGLKGEPIVPFFVQVSDAVESFLLTCESRFFA